MIRYPVEYRNLAATAFALLVLLTSACSEKESATSTPAQTSEAPMAQVVEEQVAETAPAPEPVAEPESSETAEAASATETAAADDSGAVGADIYQKACKNCHDMGVANAPKLGDSAAWAPRIAKGNDALLQSVMKGLNAMPPKGACMSCSDEELRSAMEYMVGQSS
jgi:cytochrome c5